MNLSHQDIQDILKLLDDSPYDELTLQTERFTLSLQRSADGEGWHQHRETIGLSRSAAVNLNENSEQAPEQAASEDGLLDIRSPMAGTFYRSPKPGAPPFVESGTQVDNNSVIAIIEVMKLMSSIPAGFSGEIVEILAEDAQPVTKGQLLMRVRPDGRSAQ